MSIVTGSFQELCPKFYSWIKENDTDYWFAVVGTEGIGKSNTTYAVALALMGEQALDLRNTSFTTKQFLEAISNPTQNLVILDEGVSGLFNRDWNRKDVKESIKTAVMNRTFNKIVFINAPRLDYIDKNIRDHRIHGLIICYTKQNAKYMKIERGYAAIYSNDKLDSITEFFEENPSASIPELMNVIPPSFNIRVPSIAQMNPEFWAKYKDVKVQNLKQMVSDYNDSQPKPKDSNIPKEVKPEVIKKEKPVIQIDKYLKPEYYAPDIP